MQKMVPSKVHCQFTGGCSQADNFRKKNLGLVKTVKMKFLRTPHIQGRNLKYQKQKKNRRNHHGIKIKNVNH